MDTGVSANAARRFVNRPYVFSVTAVRYLMRLLDDAVAAGHFHECW